MRTRLGSVSSLLLPLLSLSGCPRKETDEDRLRKKLDVFAVHVYAGAKATLAEQTDEAKLRAARQLLRKLLLPRADQQRGTAGAGTAELSAADLARLASSVAHLRSRGMAVVRKGEEHRPVLLALLGTERVSPKLTPNTEHALLMMIYALARFHPRAGLPIPEEIILFEASRTDPSTLELRELRGPARVLKCYALARDELCDLALKEADAARRASSIKADLAAGLKRLGAAPLSPAEVDSLAAALEALTQGAVSLCYFQRGDDEQAHRALRATLDASRRAGLGDSGEVDLLQAYLDCAAGKPTLAAGRARIAALGKRRDLDRGVAAAVPAIRDYCEGAASARFKLQRKIAFARMVVGLAALGAERSGLAARLESQPVYQTARRLGLAAGKLQQLGAAVPSSVRRAGEGAARAVWKRLRGAADAQATADAR